MEPQIKDLDTNLIASECDVLFIGLNESLLNDKHSVRSVEEKLAMAFALNKQVYFILEEDCEWNRIPFNQHPVLPYSRRPADTEAGLHDLLNDVDTLLTDLKRYLKAQIGRARTDMETIDKWVFVTGTDHTKPKHYEHLVCAALGKALARAGYGLLKIGQMGVEDFVARSYWEEYREMGYNEKGPWYQDILIHKTSPAYERWKAAKADADMQEIDGVLKSAFAVIVVGDNSDTYEVYRRAAHKTFSVPVIPFPYTGENAKRIFEELMETGSGIWKEELQRLDQPITNESEAERVVDHVIAMLDRMAGLVPVL